MNRNGTGNKVTRTNVTQAPPLRRQRSLLRTTHSSTKNHCPLYRSLPTADKKNTPRLRGTRDLWRANFDNVPQVAADRVCLLLLYVSSSTNGMATAFCPAPDTANPLRACQQVTNDLRTPHPKQQRVESEKIKRRDSLGDSLAARLQGKNANLSMKTLHPKIPIFSVFRPRRLSYPPRLSDQRRWKGVHARGPFRVGGAGVFRYSSHGNILCTAVSGKWRSLPALCLVEQL